MKKFLPTAQKIVATCILKVDNTVLLLRGSQVVTAEDSATNRGYFDVPRFEIAFGETPQEVITNKFQGYFGQEVCDIEVLDAQQVMTQNGTVQVFEIIYKVRCKGIVGSSDLPDSLGRFIFADISKLEAYMLGCSYRMFIAYL